MTKLQLALDNDLNNAFRILKEVHSFIDIIEIGTPMIIREGMNAVRQVRLKYPHLTLLADLKIMDAGKEEADIAFEAGADIVTVLGVTNDTTVEGAVQSANNWGKQIMIDMMCVTNPVESGQKFIHMGCDILCVHTAYDQQSSKDSPYQELKLLRQNLPLSKLAIAGGINNAKLDSALKYQPDIVIVGNAITGKNDYVEHAKQIKEKLTNYAG
ncbi:3-hexulose-6-phosphate synthase [Seonamhaeicola sp.]|uniref:3-hexulose-6-phosphate synthase n=1 Tax=Seonamhaeicola sp. TaxID=1912245 RepID=UPI00261157F3|nr:3-hexulose-6-phosphate synthase [Seonamhaeicola sp.]